MLIYFFLSARIQLFFVLVFTVGWFVRCVCSFRCLEQHNLVSLGIVCHGCAIWTAPQDCGWPVFHFLHHYCDKRQGPKSGHLRLLRTISSFFSNMIISMRYSKSWVKWTIFQQLVKCFETREKKKTYAEWRLLHDNIIVLNCHSMAGINIYLILDVACRHPLLDSLFLPKTFTPSRGSSDNRRATTTHKQTKTAHTYFLWNISIRRAVTGQVL